MSSAFSRHPLISLVVAAVGGLLAAGGVVWLLVAIANLFSEKAFVAHVDDSVTNWLTLHGSGTGDRVFFAVSLLGGWALVVIVAVLVAAMLARRDWRRAALVGLSGGGAFVLNTMIRIALEHAHPASATSFTSAAQSWNIPSGHAVNALVAYGILAYLLIESNRSRSVRFSIGIGAAVLIAIIGFTRVYLGVHSLSDVVTGYLAGGVWLWVCVAAYRLAAASGRGRDPVAEHGDFAGASPA